MPNADRQILLGECQMPGNCRVPNAECRMGAPCSALSPAPSSSPAHRRVPFVSAAGFTFVEVLFAIIILGVGMIMIAGVLPVAIKQNAETRDALTGQALVQSGYAYMRATIQQAPANTFPATVGAGFAGFDPAGATAPGPNDAIGRVLPLNFSVVTTLGDESIGTALFQQPALFTSRIHSSDPRFQWLAFYRRDANSSFVKLIVIAMRLQNTETFDHFAPVTMSKEVLNRGNGPFQVEVEVIEGGIEPDRIRFTGARGNKDDFDTRVAAPGAFVVINHSPAAGIDLNRPFRNNGRVFRLGQQRDDLDATGRTWDLQAGFDLASADAGPDKILNTADDIADGSMNRTGTYPVGTGTATGGAASAWIIGRGRTNPGAIATDLVFSGAAQDMTVLTTEVPAP